MGVVESAIACWVSRRPPCRLGGGPACALRTTKNPRVAENRGPPAQCQAGGTDTVPNTTGVLYPGYRRCAARLRSPTVGPCVPRIRPTQRQKKPRGTVFRGVAPGHRRGAATARRVRPAGGAPPLLPLLAVTKSRHEIRRRLARAVTRRVTIVRADPTATRRGVGEPPRRRSPSVLWPPLRGGPWDVRMGDLLRRHPVRRCLRLR